MEASELFSGIESGDNIKRVYIIHGWEGSPERDWMPWLKNELENRGFKVIVPKLPDSKHPKMDKWLGCLKNTIIPDKECYLVGHSLGCMTILRYLESLKEGQKIKGAVLVAGFASDLGYDEIKSFFRKPIEWKKIKSHCKNFIAIHSDDDPYVSMHYGDIFKEKLNATVTVQHSLKHFAGDHGVTELPVVLESILKMSK